MSSRVRQERRSGFLEQARQCLKSARPAEAADFARQALEMDSSDAAAWSLLGAALSNSDRPDEALEALRRAAALESGDAKHLYNIAAHHYRYGEKDEALNVARPALQKFPTHAGLRTLARRIEQERWQPPAIPKPPLERRDAGATAGMGEAPPVLGTPPSSRSWQFDPGPKHLHSIGFVEQMGLFWDFLLLAIFIAFSVLVILATGEFVGQSAGDLGGTAILAAGLTALVFIAAWTIDLADRRPKPVHLVLSILSILFSLPVCIVCYLPFLSIAYFIAYYGFSRTKGTSF